VLAGLRISLAISDVPAGEFGEEVLESRLADPQWTGRIAMDHFDTVEAFFALAPVLPLRMCTIFRSDDRALATFDTAGDELSAALRQVSGCSQWSVRVRGLGHTAASPVPDQSSGADYLRALATSRRAEADRFTEVGAAARRLHDRLAELAEAVETTEAPPDLLAGCTYLVRTEMTAQFLDVVRSAREGGRPWEVEVGGPWAPYSFVPRVGAVA
jgi:hypothetical protein